MAKFRKPSQAVLAARQRRESRASEVGARTEWFIKGVSDKVRLTMQQRIKIATEHVKTKMVKNISRPVTIGVGARGGRVVINRSKPGEFPKADTKQLMRTIFSDISKDRRGWFGIVGTPLDYGLILETKMDRGFLRRTLQEESGKVKRILTGPIR